MGEAERLQLDAISVRTPPGTASAVGLPLMARTLPVGRGPSLARSRDIDGDGGFLPQGVMDRAMRRNSEEGRPAGPPGARRAGEPQPDRARPGPAARGPR